MPTLVTGATGFLGGHLVQALLARGDGVRALVRSPEAAEPLGRLGVELVQGDITNKYAIRAAVAECDNIFHLAGIVSHDLADLPQMRVVNVEATRAVLEAAEPGARVVHVSSVAALGPASSPHARADEQQTLPDKLAWLPYATTKREGELVAIEAAAKGVDVVIANPGFLLGPGDVHRISTWPIDAYLSGKLRVGTAERARLRRCTRRRSGADRPQRKRPRRGTDAPRQPRGNLSWRAPLRTRRPGLRQTAPDDQPSPGVAALGSANRAEAW